MRIRDLQELYKEVVVWLHPRLNMELIGIWRLSKEAGTRGNDLLNVVAPQNMMTKGWCIREVR
jgi:hypothetical protein